MSTLIDSLKRLERVGSEDSATTRKLLQATREVSQKIVATIDKVAGGVFPSGKYYSEFLVALPRSYFCWCKGSGESGLCHDASNIGLDFVNLTLSPTRAVALAFAADLADGLLGEIMGTVEDMKRENAQAITTLTTLSIPKA